MTDNDVPAERVLWGQEIQNDVERIKTLLSSGIFLDANQQHPLRQSAFIELMICLNDLLAKAKNEAQRVSFTDDVNPEVGDITDLVALIRNAACHIPSRTRHVDNFGNRLLLMTVYGRFPHAFVANGVDLGCDYEDDLAFFYGNEKIYFTRHIVRAFTEVRAKLLLLLPDTKGASNSNYYPNLDL
jgi:hypothetical protein